MASRYCSVDLGFPVLQVLNGQAWVIVDGAILDVSAFAGRHPGGARLIRNAMGTDITNQLLGQEISVDPRQTRLSPHIHTAVRCCLALDALEPARTMNPC